MTTSAVPLPDVPTLDVSSTPRLSFSRLTAVELRKAWDTRAGFWLLLSIVGVTLLINVIFVLAAHDGERTFPNFMAASGAPQGILLPVLGILLVTSEWGQRTNLTTFTLEPSRGRVIAAKVTAAVVLGALAALIALGIAALATLAFGDDNAFDGVGIDVLGKILLTQELGILLGLAFGLILLNSAAAIVLNYLLPIVFSIIASVWGWLNQYQPWVDLNDAQTPLQNLDDLTGHQWAQLVTATLIWVVAPFIAGLIRVSKAEVK
jgi:ABC-type transport system involved in multi-copper enzyme maturation permease subunit